MRQHTSKLNGAVFHQSPKQHRDNLSLVVWRAWFCSRFWCSWARPSSPPPRPASAAVAAPPTRSIAPRPAMPAINWEEFMGAKLFAWIGGLALFLGVAFFVKYSFEHNLIPPEVRVAIGFALGIGLLA